MVNAHLGYNELTARNTSFSNVNTGKPVWWLNINPQKFSSELHILLAKNPGLIWLKIKADTFPNLENVFRIRNDNGYIDLEIPIGGNQYMRDTKSGGTGYDFKPHIQREWNKSEYGARLNPVTQATGTEANVIIIKPGDPIPPIIDLSETPKDGPVFEGTDVPVQYLFEYLDNVHNLYAFLNDFPDVSAEQALKAIRERINSNSVIHSDRDYVSGMPRFKGTRMPVRILFDYLADGYTIEGFLDSFDTAVTREQAVKALEAARESLESMAYETATLAARPDTRKNQPRAATHRAATPEPRFRNPPIKRRKALPNPPSLINSRS